MEQFIKNLKDLYRKYHINIIDYLNSNNNFYRISFTISH